MSTYKKHLGITLVDVLLAVTIVAILTTIVLTVATSIQNKALQQKCEGLLATVNAALQQYKEFDYELPLNITDVDEIAFYRSLQFPPDCNEFPPTGNPSVSNEIDKLLDVTSNFNLYGQPFDPNGALYFFLSRIPKCRETLGSIDPEFIYCAKNSNDNYQKIVLNMGGSDREYPWNVIVDPWGNGLKYDYYVNDLEDTSLSFLQMKETLRNFPLIRSAGPDGVFNTADDLINREGTKSTEHKP